MSVEDLSGRHTVSGGLRPARKDNTPEEPGAIITSRLIEDRKRARTIEHRMDHQPPFATCEGCQARARQKKHHKGAYEASEKDRSMIITMDQVNTFKTSIVLQGMAALGTG